MYSVGACATLGMTNQNALSEDLESDPFLNSALQMFTCELYYRFGSFLAPLSIGQITSRHYMSNGMLKILKIEEEQMKETKPASKYAGLGAAMAAELMVGFWLGVRVILAFGVVYALNYFVGALTSNK